METWRVALERGDAQQAWDLFLERYRRLILATLRRTLGEPEDVAEVFAEVCQALAADDLALLRRFNDQSPSGARLSTWLVVVVRNRAIDWSRRRDGRRRPTPPAGLSPLQRAIFEHVFVEHRSHGETYELLAEGAAAGLTYPAFLRELAHTYRVVERSAPRGLSRYLHAPPKIEPAPVPHPHEELLAAEARARLNEVLESLPDDTRAALQLFVVEELPAARVAQAVGWRGAKDVYNRVYRALSRIREALERQGLRRGDL